MFIKLWDSRPFQLSTYTVFDEESNFPVNNEGIRRPEGKNRNNEFRNITFFSQFFYSLFFEVPGGYINSF